MKKHSAIRQDQALFARKLCVRRIPPHRGERQSPDSEEETACPVRWPDRYPGSSPARRRPRSQEVEDGPGPRRSADLTGVGASGATAADVSNATPRRGPSMENRKRYVDVTGQTRREPLAIQGVDGLRYRQEIRVAYANSATAISDHQFHWKPLSRHAKRRSPYRRWVVVEARSGGQVQAMSAQASAANSATASPARPPAP